MTEIKNLKISVEGMSCVGCEKTIRSALEVLPGIDSVQVNVMGGKVNVAYDPARAKPTDMVEAIQGTGYIPVEDEVSFTVDGMSCAGCVGKVEKAISSSSRCY